MGQKLKNLKKTAYSVDVWALIRRRPRAARATQLCPIGTLKVRQLENGYIALTQSHVNRLR